MMYRYDGGDLHALNVSLGSSRAQTANCDNTGTDEEFQSQNMPYFKCQITSVPKSC